MELTPAKIVEELNKYIVGQDEAKKAVAIALCNRERRRCLPPELQKEVTPKNILMIGPTGVGKTEIARRIAEFIDAPFIKVEATRFTEVGYVGRDVESIITELVEASVMRVYERRLREVEDRARSLAFQRLVDYLCNQLPQLANTVNRRSSPRKAKLKRLYSRQYVARLLHSQKLEDAVVEIEVGEPLTPPLEDRLDADDYWGNFSGYSNYEGQRRLRRVPVREARRILTREEASKLLDFEEIAEQGLNEAQEKGVVFIDELDKLCGPQVEVGRDVSGEGVQRDLLSIIEGTSVMTRYGMVRTDHILFIAAGVFSRNKPSDLIPELQGRFPLRVELKPLTQDDLVRILTEPRNSLTRQYQALLATEGVELEFTPDGISEIARMAALMNERVENIGARRLYTVMEKVLEDVSFTAPEYRGRKVIIDREYVQRHIGKLIHDENLSRYIL